MFRSICVALVLFAPAATPAFAAQDAVVAQPNPTLAGGSVTLRWYFTGTKVVVSGGRFGRGAVVTGRTHITDTIRRATRYTFDVWYVGQVSAPGGRTTTAPLHARYSVVADVVAPLPDDLVAYRDSRGWQMSIPRGWKCDPVSLPDPANNALMYFQPEFDSIERLAVSIVPAADLDSAHLMNRVQKSLQQSYESAQVLTDTETTSAGVPAVLSVFTGGDMAHDGTRTQSIVLAFVRESRGYVVSARTRASIFPLRQPLFERMVRSVVFHQSAAQK